jgi:LysM repeat protein
MRRTAHPVVFFALVCVILFAGALRGSADPQSFEYTVRRGDTLGEIARRFEVTLEDLRSWNPEVEPTRMRPGQTIRIARPLRRVEHRIASGETLSAIASRYRVSIPAILRWNPRARRRVRAGAELLIYTEAPESVSESVGTPQRGHLESGVRLPPHPLYVIRDRGRSYGTVEAVVGIRDAFEAVRLAHEDTHPVRVHDISRERGGSLHGHHSHQSGRDADIAYFRLRAPREPTHFVRVHPDSLDVARQWTLVHHWLQSGEVEAIFMDHRLQQPLYEHAREQGVSRAQLSRWFQYPRPPSQRFGVIRHHPQHADHLHVRFACHVSDPRCRDHEWQHTRAQDEE